MALFQRYEHFVLYHYCPFLLNDIVFYETTSSLIIYNLYNFFLYFHKNSFLMCNIDLHMDTWKLTHFSAETLLAFLKLGTVSVRQLILVKYGPLWLYLSNCVCFFKCNIKRKQLCAFCQSPPSDMRTVRL